MKVKIGPFPKNTEEKRKIKIKLHKYDTWNLDHTLALIILPALKQFKEQKQSYALIEKKDWIKESYEDIQDGFSAEAWDDILDEMIFAFEYVGSDDPTIDLSKETEEYQNRVNKGFELFGKYFRALWD
jgi:hypothetical protein